MKCYLRDFNKREDLIIEELMSIFLVIAGLALLVIGGDFNTQINVGSRGLALQNLVETFSLCIANESDVDWDNQWTFRSNLGIQRKIDFVLVSKIMDIQTANASMEVNLGSDHRAVLLLV